MYSFEDIIGEEQLKTKMKSVAQSGMHSHAYLIAGDKRCGKTTLANCFVKALQCEGEGEKPCGMCMSCMQMDVGAHPDVIYVQHEKPSVIGVDDIRDGLTDDIVIKPYRSEKKIYIIDDAQKMSVAAQNALLKTLEEPPAYAIIIMITTSTEVLLPTILSRTVLLPVRPLRDDIVKKYLMTRKELPDYRAEVVTAFARGNIGRAGDLIADEEFEKKKEEAVSILKNIDKTDYETIYRKASEFGKEKKEKKENKEDGNSHFDDLLDFFLAWYRDALVYKTTNRERDLIFREEIQYIKKVSKDISFENFDRIFEAIHKARGMIRANVNIDTVADLLLITVKESYE